MTPKFLYESTNGKAEKVTFKDALLKGQAPDGGLYTPTEIPNINIDEIVSLKGKPYNEVAYAITRKFLEGEIPDTQLKRIVDDAHNFPPRFELLRDRISLMWLDEGPTAAFKDYAAQLMSRLMQYYLNIEGRKILILTATSGDTGSAVASAFHGAENIDVLVLFPSKEVTDRQRMQMTTLGGNVSCIAVDGKFDDCQKIVKQAFNDPELQDLNMSSANSINFGRLLPQMVYYFYGYANLFEEVGERIVYSVPSGNFGDLMGGVYARKMGLPVERFVVATNENDEFPKFMESGVYSPISPSKVCISNAMNVGNPSNLARLIHVYGGYLNELGVLERNPDMQALNRDFYAVSISNDETRKAIKAVYDEFKIILEPHGAVGYAGLLEYLSDFTWEGLTVSLETADPAKFPEEIVKLLGFEPPLPESLQGLEGIEEEYGKMGPGYASLKNYLLKNY